MSIVELIPRRTQIVPEETAVWHELTGLGADGLPLPHCESNSLYGLIQRALRAKGRLSQFADRAYYGSQAAQQRQQIGLHLCSLWLQRLLLCHQLQQKLMRIHGGDRSYRFFSADYLSNWSELADFFLHILPQPIMFRSTPYSFVPPLDIPLFEEHELEKLLPMGDLEQYEKRGEQLLPQMLACLNQQDENLIGTYRLQSPVPEAHALNLASSLLENWLQKGDKNPEDFPAICDPMMLQADLLTGALRAWMHLRFPAKKPEYKVAAGPGGFNRHVPKGVQQLHAEYYRQMAAFAEKQLYGVAPDALSLSWVKAKLWAVLLAEVPFDATSCYELFYPLPKFHHKLCYGPSLISQYRIDSDMFKMLKGNKLRFRLYCSAIGMYQDAQTEKEKEEARGMLEDMQKNFRSHLQASHPDFQRLKRLEKALIMKESPLFADKLPPEVEAKQLLHKQQLLGQIERLKARLEGELRMRKTFEWRFQFPELLHRADARFCGFDIILLQPEEPQNTEEEISLNQSLSLSYKISKSKALLGSLLPDNFIHKMVFQKGRKTVFEQLSLLEKSYLDGQGFGELCTGKLQFILQKGPESL